MFSLILLLLFSDLIVLVDYFVIVRVMFTVRLGFIVHSFDGLCSPLTSLFSAWPCYLISCLTLVNVFLFSLRDDSLVFSFHSECISFIFLALVQSFGLFGCWTFALTTNCLLFVKSACESVLISQHMRVHFSVLVLPSSLIVIIIIYLLWDWSMSVSLFPKFLKLHSFCVRTNTLLQTTCLASAGVSDSVTIWCVHAVRTVIIWKSFCFIHF